MIEKFEIENKINNLLSEKLFAGIRKIIVKQQKEKFIKTTEYLKSSDIEKRELLNSNYKQWFESLSTFFLSYKTIYALHPIVLREIKIREFASEEVIRVKADYIYDEIEFSAYYPTHYNQSMTKEIEDCISDLKNQKYSHIVDNFISKTDTERTPHEPLTTAELKYSAFYLFGFKPERVTELSKKLFHAKLITNPETNGWLINDAIAEDIITVLNQKYPEEKILQHKRNFTDKIVDRYSQECIRPTMISSKYFPKNIRESFEFKSIKIEVEYEDVDLIKLYEFIFYITLSTQMKNSVYDTSSIEIVVGNKKLKEQANVLIEGEDNWEELTGQIIKRITHNADTNKKQTIVLPEIAPDVILKPLDIYAYSYQSKRPPRYGIGRFVTQVLEKYSIGINKEHDEIIKELIESKAVRLIKTMLHPQENAVMLINWMILHMPLLLDLEYLSELNEKIEMASNNEITISSILDEIDRIINAAFESSGFVFDDEPPSLAKINLLKSVAMKNNLTIDKSVYESSIKIDMILAKYPAAEPIKIGSCPECNSLVYQKEFIKSDTGEIQYYFSCEKYNKHTGCSFSMWDSYVKKFFSDKALELFTVEERASTLKKILSKKKGYLFNGFIAKNQKPYDARVFTETYEDRDTKQKKWVFALDFVKTRK
ncbi:MAG: DNA topoisomerase [Sulfurimonas sp.]